jgi:hypothetical protein
MFAAGGEVPTFINFVGYLGWSAPLLLGRHNHSSLQFTCNSAAAGRVLGVGRAVCLRQLGDSLLYGGRQDLQAQQPHQFCEHVVAWFVRSFKRRSLN